MSKYTKSEQEFLDKAAISIMQGVISGEMWNNFMKDYRNSRRGYDQTHEGYVAMEVYILAEALLTERKKLFGDE